MSVLTTWKASSTHSGERGLKKGDMRSSGRASIGVAMSATRFLRVMLVKSYAVYCGIERKFHSTPSWFS